MVTFLDIGLVEYFNVAFAFLFVLALVFALLQKTKFLGSGIAINSILAAVVAFAVVLSENAVALIQFIIPWFAVAVIFLVLLLLVLQTMGLKDTDLPNVIRNKTVHWTLIGVALIIIVAGLANVFGQSALEARDEAGEVTAEGSQFEQNIYAIMFHPKILAMLILFTIAIFAVALLSSSP